MDRKKIKKMIMELLKHADYDLSKDFNEKLAEDPELAKEEMEILIDIVEKHIKSNCSKGDVIFP